MTSSAMSGEANPRAARWFDPRSGGWTHDSGLSAFWKDSRSLSRRVASGDWGVRRDGGSPVADSPYSDLGRALVRLGYIAGLRATSTAVSGLFRGTGLWIELLCFVDDWCDNLLDEAGEGPGIDS